MAPKLILVDSSAWILGFRGQGPAKLHAYLRDVLEKNLAVTTPFIALELLQGCRTSTEFHRLKINLESLIVDRLDDLEWESLYRFGFSLRKKGLTVPTLDILLAFHCLERNYILLHHDRHFRMIRNHSDLMIVDFLS